MRWAHREGGIKQQGVSRGSPLSASLLIIYDERMMMQYNKNLAKQIKEGLPTENTRTNESENEWARYQFRRSKNTRSDGFTPRPCFEIRSTDVQKRDAVKSTDDAAIKTKGAEEIRHKFIAFSKATKDFRLPINWNKVTILITKHDTNIWEL